MEGPLDAWPPGTPGQARLKRHQIARGNGLWETGTLRVGKIWGIAIDVHLAFGLVVFAGAVQGWIEYDSLTGAFYGVAAVFLLFACVLLHELAHGLQARAFGLVVKRVILLPVGGVAQLATPPSRPKHELVIALAGPAVNLGLTLITGAIMLLLGPVNWLDRGVMLQMMAQPGPQSALVYLFAVNLSLFLFNIIPAFPMDGGRILRAGLALTMKYVLATRIAAWVGRILALAMGAIGLFGLPALGVPQNLLLVFVAAIVFSGAHNEEIYVRRQWALARVEVKEIYQRKIETVSPWDALTAPLIARLFKYERILPVIVDQRIVGLLGYDEARHYANRGNSFTVAHAMRTSFPTLRPKDTLWVALQEMTSVQLTTLPVVEGNQFQGIVSLDDIDQAWRITAR